MPHLEISEAELVHSNIVSNDYHRDLGALCLLLNKAFDQLQDIYHIKLIFQFRKSSGLSIQNLHTSH